MGLPDHSYGIRASARDNLRSWMGTTMEGRRAVSLGRASRGPRSLTAPPPYPSSHTAKCGRGVAAGRTYPQPPTKEKEAKRVRTTMTSILASQMHAQNHIRPQIRILPPLGVTRFHLPPKTLQNRLDLIIAMRVNVDASHGDLIPYLFADAPRNRASSGGRSVMTPSSFSDSISRGLRPRICVSTSVLCSPSSGAERRNVAGVRSR